MNLEVLQGLGARLEWSESTGSTNSDLVAAVTSDEANWPDFSVLGADYQASGRGRSGRIWEAPAGSSIFVSVLLRPSHSVPTGFGWLPLLAGLAVRDALAQFAPDQNISLKWPNDVLVGNRKIAGVLSEFVAANNAVVVGAGINLKQTASELPIELATSLALAGAEGFTRESVLASYLTKFRAEYELLVDSDFEAERSGLRSKVLQACGTIGREVRAILPGENELLGRAIDIDFTGRLVIKPAGGGEPISVSAGDIVHLRH